MPAAGTAAVGWSETDELSVNAIRMLSAEMVERAQSGHPGMPMGFALPAHVLWTRHLRFNPDNPFWRARDRFVLSCGHGSALLYCLLHFSGYDLQMEDLKRFRQLGSRTPGHPELGVTPGVETTTGPLGQGFGNAVGIALAQRYVREALDPGEGFDPLDHFVYVIASDGDLQEGVSGEASSLAGRQQLGRLIVLYDDNRISIDGGTELAWVEDVTARYDAYGWQTASVDGGDPAAIHGAIVAAKRDLGRPSLIKVRTHIGFGSPNKQDRESVHGAPLGEEELVLTREALGWTRDPFTVPDASYRIYAEAADRGRDAHETWLARFETWVENKPGRRELWDHLMGGAGKEYVTEELPLGFEPGKPVATRAASGVALNWIAERDRAFFGGCADLSGSVKTLVSGGDFLPGVEHGRNIRFGVREHAMGASANGIALYGSLRAYAGTFLIFSDYMRPSIRLAAMMKLPVIYVFSHDSVGVGEDGSTHQPIEQYAALRAIPNLWVIRPGDAAETVWAWKLAYDRRDGPIAILTTRQKLPVIDRRDGFAPAKLTMRGAYTIADAPGGDPELILLASGSELSLALAARDRLVADGVEARVVSFPCWELFEEQDEAYRESVFPANVRARMSVEAGVAQGWSRWVGDRGECFSLERFGASAPGAELFEHFGFTVDRVVERAKQLVRN